MRVRITVGLFAAAVAAALGTGGFTSTEPRTAAHAQDAQASRTGDVIVRFKSDATLAGVAGALTAAEAAPAESSSSGLVLVEPDAGQSVDDAIASLSADPNVEFVEADTVVSIVQSPNDIFYPQQQWHYEQIGLPAAWDVTTGNSNVVVAVIDTGVMVTHQDLDTKISSGGDVGANFVAYPISTSSSSSGVRITHTFAHNYKTGDQVVVSGHCQFVGSPPSCNALYNGTWTITVLDATSYRLNGSTYSSAGTGGSARNTSPRDDHGHGTFVAGTVAAESNNASWVAGVCWTCTIMPVKVLGSSGSGSTFDVAAGIDWARTHGADVINLSLGSADPSATLQTAVDAAWNAGIVVVAASGNNNGPVLYPAAYDSALAVGATNSAGAKASFSNYGPSLDVMAPGESVVSTVLDSGTGTYGAGSGTSFAAPHVAGVVGLMIADGITDKTTIVSTLKSTATDMGGAGFDNLTGWGIVNAADAISEPDTTPPTVAITSPAEGQAVLSDITATVTASDAVGVTAVRFWLDNVYQGYDLTAPYTKPIDVDALGDGPHRLLVDASDAAGNKAWHGLNFNVGDDTTNPVASITSPTPNEVVTGTINVTVNATDNIGVAKVRFWLDGAYQGYDGTAPYARSIDTTALTDGLHRVLIEAADAAGNATYGAVNFVVDNGGDTTAPAVSITSPGPGETVSGLVALGVSATDAVGVAKVRFWLDGVYLTYDSTAPYSLNVNTSVLTNGTHRLLVEASDHVGNKSWASVNFTISN